MLTFQCSLIRKFFHRLLKTCTNIGRQHPAVMPQAAKVFMFIVQALEAETLQGNTATRIVESAKTLLGAAGLDPAALLQQMSPETQQTVRAYFG